MIFYFFGESDALARGKSRCHRRLTDAAAVGAVLAGAGAAYAVTRPDEVLCATQKDLFLPTCNEEHPI